MELCCPLGTTRRLPQEKFPSKPHNKSFIDQACSVKITRKKEGSQYPAILTEKAWSITHVYIMARSVRGQDEPNPVL